MLKKYIGTKSFYRRVLTLTIPIVIQSGITNFVSMLDNVMVGRIGTLEMSGVAIANQLIFVFSLCIFGAVSGAGIFGAQFVGKGDNDGVRYVFRFKLMSATLISIVGIGAFILFGKSLISTYLTGDDSVGDTAAALEYGWEYLKIILIGLLPYSVTQVYASSLRETDNSLPPMVAGTVAVFINLLFNYILIFGNFGAPRLGVAGAAIATVISRYVELVISIIWAFAIRKKIPFIVGAYKSLYVPASLVRGIFTKGAPIMLNETMWSAGMAALSQSFSTRGISAVAAVNIETTFYDVFAVAFLSLGSSIGIIIGQILGTADFDKAKDYSRKLMAFSFMTGVVSGILFFVAAIFIPAIYNTTADVAALSTRLMQIMAILMPVEALCNASYFTLRSGGKVIITVLFDSVFMWSVSVLTAFLLSRLTTMEIIPLFALVQALAIFKASLGVIFVKKGIWLKSIV